MIISNMHLDGINFNGLDGRSAKILLKDGTDSKIVELRAERFGGGVFGFIRSAFQLASKQWVRVTVGDNQYLVRVEDIKNNILSFKAALDESSVIERRLNEQLNMIQNLKNCGVPEDKAVKIALYVQKNRDNLSLFKNYYFKKSEESELPYTVVVHKKEFYVLAKGKIKDETKCPKLRAFGTSKIAKPAIKVSSETPVSGENKNIFVQLTMNMTNVANNKEISEEDLLKEVMKELAFQKKFSGMDFKVVEYSATKNETKGRGVDTFKQYVDDQMLSIIVPMGEGTASNLRKLGIDESLELEFFCQEAELIKSMHDQGYVHGDIKPDNILVVSEEGVKKPLLSDFGHCRRASRAKEESNKQFKGTPLYSPPPNFFGGEVVDEKRLDVYAFTITLFEQRHPGEWLAIKERCLNWDDAVKELVVKMKEYASKGGVDQLILDVMIQFTTKDSPQETVFDMNKICQKLKEIQNKID